MMMNTMARFIGGDKNELYQTDCLKLLKSLKLETLDLTFADPPLIWARTVSLIRVSVPES